MTDQGDMTPAVWDPTARDGAGGWVRRPAPPRSETPAPPPAPPAGPPLPPPPPGAVGDQGPPLAARPYLPSAPVPPVPPPAAAPGGPPGYGYPQPPRQAPQPQPPRPPQPATAANGFPAHLQPQRPQQPPYGAPTPPPPYGGGAAAPAAPGQPYPPQGVYPPQGPYPPVDRLDLPNRYEEFDQFEEARPSRRTPMLLGLALLLLLGIGTGLALQNDSGTAQAKAAPPSTSPQPSASAPASADASSTTGSPSTAASPSASASASGSAGPNAQVEAKALDDLLSRGESAKAPIGSAVAKVESCPAKADIESAAQTFDAGASQRDQLIADLGKLNLADLPGGADAAAGLKTAWQQSGDIDRAYAAWARTVSAQGCGGGRTAPNTPDKQHADDLNPQATQAKKDFVGKWNVIAGSYGLTARTWDRI